uniref:Vesicle transport v-SNARE N-terminal domain-containing protein n=1 Tax=Timema bartmani TaxID=61472 RepID=A0A7R9I3Q8_9NEOP|nr:unnamed protein product [Timema bartmani]
MEEAQELLEQMELEVREVDAASRPRLRTHVDSYRAELGRLSQEFLKVRSPPFQDDYKIFERMTRRNTFSELEFSSHIGPPELWALMLLYQLNHGMVLH